jgi:hypothetical protein
MLEDFKVTDCQLNLDPYPLTQSFVVYLAGVKKSHLPRCRSTAKVKRYIGLFQGAQPLRLRGARIENILAVVPLPSNVTCNIP